MAQLLLSLRCSHVLLQSIIWSLCSNYHGFFVAFCCSFIGIFESTCFFFAIITIGYFCGSRQSGFLMQESLRFLKPSLSGLFIEVITGLYAAVIMGFLLL